LRWVRRSYGWIVPLSPGEIHPWSLGRLTRRVDRARSTLEAESFYFDLADPLQELGDADSRGRVAETRLLLIGGEAVALLLAFAALAAAATRRESALTRWRLERAGARASQTRLLTGAETVGLAGVATLLGWGLGIGVGAVVARIVGGPVATVLSESAASEKGLVIALALAVAAAGILALSFSARRPRSRPFALSAVDVAALGALATIGLALARGVADVDALAQGRGTGWMLFALPLLVAFVAAVVAARAFHPVARMLERTTRNLSVPVRLAALSLARHPAQSIAASTFLLASVGLAVFSLAYRSTLVQGQDDEARFANPTGVIVRSPQPQRVPLLGGLSPQADHWLSQQGAVPLLRLNGLVGRPSRSVEVVGISASTLRHPPFWRDDFASRSPQALATTIDPGRSVSLNGVRLPTAARELVMPLETDGDPLRIVLSFRGKGDRFVDVDLRAVPSSNSSLTVRVPRAARGGLVLGMTFAPTEADVHNSTPAAGTLKLGQFRVRTADGIHRLAIDFGQWTGIGGVKSRLTRNGVRLRYFVTNDVVSRFRSKQPTDHSPVHVIATAGIAALAGPSGLLPLQVEGEPFVGRVVATARRFPTVSGDFVLADREALSTALNADAPGSAVTDEIWLTGSSASDERRMKAVLSRPAFAGLETSFRRDLRAELDREPVARASILALLVAAVVGFVLALAGLALALTTDIRDERAELFDLEAQGATPALLRRHLRLRSFGVLGFGVLLGLGLGAILSTIVVDVVRVTAGGDPPEPPLLLSFDWPLLLGGIGLFVLVAIVVAMVVTWQALRGARAVRGTGLGT
jgi:MFS family permease